MSTPTGLWNCPNHFYLILTLPPFKLGQCWGQYLHDLCVHFEKQRSWQGDGKAVVSVQKAPWCRIWLCSACSGASWLGKIGMIFCHFPCTIFSLHSQNAKAEDSDCVLRLSQSHVHMHVSTCSQQSQGFRYSCHHEIVTREPGVACSHVKMKNEHGCHGWLLLGVGVGQLSLLDECLYPCMETAGVCEKRRMLLRGSQSGGRDKSLPPPLEWSPGKGSQSCEEGAHSSHYWL